MIEVPFAEPRIESTPAVGVRTFGRLHMGFLDPYGTLGRRFGSVGLVIDGFACEVQIGAADADRLIAADDDSRAELPRAAAHLQALRARTGMTRPLALRLRRVLPPHAGFGSGTQLALAVGHAFARWHGLRVPTPTLAQWLGRGLRSGIGIAGFDQGGLLVDGGPGPQGSAAPILARVLVPEAWRVIVAVDPQRQGLSGDEERRAIAALSPLSREQAADLCHQVLMRVLPGAASADFEAFARGVNAVQGVLGEHFAPVQGGAAYTSASVGRLMRWLRDRAGAAVGQSSWGPTGFAIVPDEQAAAQALSAARQAEVADPQLALHVVKARSGGAETYTASA